MKIKQTTSALLALGVFLAAAPVSMAILRAEPAPAVTVEGGLDEPMQVLQGSMKRIDKALEKKDLKDVLPIVLDMQKAAHTAKTQVPPMGAEMTDAKKKDEFVLGFRKQMIELEKSLCDLEIAVLDGKVDDAKKIFDTQVKASKKSGHDKYKGN